MCETTVPPVLTKRSTLKPYLAKLVDSVYSSTTFDNDDVRRDCTSLLENAHAGKLSVDEYLAELAGYSLIGKKNAPVFGTVGEVPGTDGGGTPDEEEPSEGRINGPGTLPPIVWTVDSGVMLPDGMTVTGKIAGNARILAAVALKRITARNIERPSIDSLFTGRKRRRDELKFLQSYEDTRVTVQSTRQPDLFQEKVLACLGSSPHDETSHEGCMRVFVSCLEETDVQYSKIALAVFLGVDALCHLIAGDQKTIGAPRHTFRSSLLAIDGSSFVVVPHWPLPGGLDAITKKVAAKIAALVAAGSTRASLELSVLCRWWRQLRSCLPKAGDFHVRIHLCDLVVGVTGSLILHPVRNAYPELPVLPDKFNVKQFNHWEKQVLASPIIAAHCQFVLHALLTRHCNAGGHFLRNYAGGRRGGIFKKPSVRCRSGSGTATYRRCKN